MPWDHVDYTTIGEYALVSAQERQASVYVDPEDRHEDSPRAGAPEERLRKQELLILQKRRLPGDLCDPPVLTGVLQNRGRTIFYTVIGEGRRV